MVTQRKRTASKKGAHSEVSPSIHEQVFLIEQGEIFNFYVDKAEQLLVSLSDVLTTINGDKLPVCPKEETDNHAYSEVYRMFLSEGAVFGIEAIGSKQISGRWFVTPEVAKEGCMIVARIGDTAQVRKRAKALSKLLLSNNFTDIVSGQLKAIYEHQANGRQHE